MQLLKLDNQHTQARRMLAEMNQHLTLKERAEQAQQKRCQAEDLLAEKKYDEALRLLEEASRLVPGDRSYTEQLTAVRARKETADQIIGYLQQADAAKKVGDYRSAQSIVEKALKLDTNNSRLRATYLALIKQAEEAALKAKVKTLLDAAKKERCSSADMLTRLRLSGRRRSSLQLTKSCRISGQPRRMACSRLSAGNCSMKWKSG